MAKKTCSKGHIYDSGIYGDNCPFCPSSGTQVNDTNKTDGVESTAVSSDERTKVNGGTNNVNPTVPMTPSAPNGTPGGQTIFGPANPENTNLPQGRRIVAVLTTYDISPLGTVFNIYEGKNYVGRDLKMDVSISNDFRISGTQSLILCQAAGEFMIYDERSSNGTFVNGERVREIRINSFDVIKIGDTSLIFIAIPQINL